MLSSAENQRDDYWKAIIDNNDIVIKKLDIEVDRKYAKYKKLKSGCKAPEELHGYPAGSRQYEEIVRMNERAMHDEASAKGNVKRKRDEFWKDKIIETFSAIADKTDRIADIEEMITEVKEIGKFSKLIEFGGIEWVVLKEDDKVGRALILSDEIICKMPYHSEDVPITWESCDLRQWLNLEFLTRFSDEEEKLIVPTKLKTADNPEYEIPGGNDTTDLVFLLSAEEIPKYLTNISDHIAFDESGYFCRWWLRTPGLTAENAAEVCSNGFLSLFGYDIFREGGVRPAMWLDMKAFSLINN